MRRLRTRSAPLLTLLVSIVGACSNSSAPATTTPAAPGSTVNGGAPTVTSAPRASRVRLTLDRSGPIISAGDGPAGYPYAYAAAATRDLDGRLVLFTAWFGPEDGSLEVMITMSTSPDGRSWEVGTSPAFALEIGASNPGPIPAAALQLGAGSWLLYGWSLDTNGGTSASSWRASASSPGGPWLLDSADLLEAGPAGAWDSSVAVPGSVQRVGDEYAMWYEGEGPGRSIRGDIGLATSADGLTWTKFDDPATTDARRATSDPVIPTGICGPETAMAVEEVQVERGPNGLVALFFGTGASETTGIFGAVSTDGRAWQCGSPTALLVASDIADGALLHTMTSVPLGDGRVGLIIESITGGRAGQHSDLWWATVEVGG